MGRRACGQQTRSRLHPSRARGTLSPFGHKTRRCGSVATAPNAPRAIPRRTDMNRIGRCAFVMLVAGCMGVTASLAWSQQLPKPGAEIKALAPVFGASGVWHGKVEPGAMGPDSKETVSHGRAMGRPIAGGMWD